MQFRSCLRIGNVSGSERVYCGQSALKRDSKRTSHIIRAIDHSTLLKALDIKPLVRGSPHLLPRLRQMQDLNGTSHQNGAHAPDIPATALPKHVAMILDGNRRWAKQQGMQSCLKGHEAGANTLKAVAVRCQELGIRALTVFAFSTENWQRSTTEVNGLLQLMESTIATGLDELCDAGVKLTFFGELHRLSPSLQSAISRCV